MLKFDIESRAKAVEVAVGEQFELVLSENPATGFRWRFKQKAEPVCTLLKDFLNPGQAPGEPGTHHWDFKVTAQGRGTIELVYTRSWESANHPRIFELHIIATD